MKKTVCRILLITMLIFVFVSCHSEKTVIEGYEWKMRSVMHAENDCLIVDAASEENVAHPEAKIVDMMLVARDGEITLTDLTNQKKYKGSYSVSGKNPKGTDYRVIIDGKEGFATVAMTTYSNGTEEPTLPINLGEYSIYFYAY